MEKELLTPFPRNPKEFEDNINHISFYQDEGRIRKANAYGEAAAFACMLNESSVSLSELIRNLLNKFSNRIFTSPRNKKP